MKKLITVLLVLVINTVIFAITPPVPQKISYQAVIRNSSNALVTNQPVGMKISIIYGTSAGSVVYAETQTPTTNANGLINIAIGTGTVVSGTFSAIEWGHGPHFIKTETDPAGGTAYTITATSELLSVPYALYAKDVQNKQWQQSGSDIYYSSGNVGIGSSNPVVPLEVASAGIPHIKLINTSADANSVQKITFWKGNTEKFAIGYDLWGTGEELFTLYDTPNSKPVLHIKSGKVGIGVNPGADFRQFQVKAEGIQAIAGVNNSASYATIYAQNLGTGPAAEFRNKIRLADGTEGAGKVLTSDANGYTSWNPVTINSDPANFTGDGSADWPLKLHAMGASVGQVLKWDGSKWDNANDDPGPWSSNDNYVYNSTGKKFGMGINTPSRKLTIADAATSAYMNIVNTSTGYSATDGILLGIEGLNGWLTTYESGNLYLGTNGQARITVASDGDVGIGTSTPLQKLDVNGAVNIRGNTGDQALFCSSAEAVWYNGTYFSWGYGGQYNFFGDKVTIGTSAVPGYDLVVNGTAAKSGGGSWSTLSDVRMKDLTGEYQKGLDEIIQLKPVTFTYKAGNPRELNSNEPQIGFVAQDVQKIFPEAVSECKDGYLDFNIHAVNVALVNAVKELKAENDRLKQENSDINARLENLEKAILKK